MRTIVALAAVAAVLLLVALLASRGAEKAPPPDRREVIFWHFWGGKDREVVEGIVDRFNNHPDRERDRFFVRAIAMPGNNLDLKLLLSVTGGDPPDLVNQDDPIVADWAHRGALLPIDQVAATAGERDKVARLQDWLFPAARRLGEYEGRLYAVCNGLDIRALYYNKQMLAAHDLQPPQTIAQLDHIAVTLAKQDARGNYERLGYVPDPRRLWAWGIAFGGRFYDPVERQITLDSPEILAAFRWMASYGEGIGKRNVAAFRTGDQSLPGGTFPLLAGRYAVIMDGQWRVRDIAEFEKKRGQRDRLFDVCPLPRPQLLSHGKRLGKGPDNAGDPLHSAPGWVNGNFFIVPKNADNSAGAWAFMKFWSGFDGHEGAAARHCAAGGWIPPSQQVVDRPVFQRYLDRYPLFAKFVAMAGSPYQVPRPVIPGAPYYDTQVNDMVEAALYRPGAPPPDELLRETHRRVERRVQAARQP